jgi:hypothetical protein
VSAGDDWVTDEYVADAGGEVSRAPQVLAQFENFNQLPTEQQVCVVCGEPTHPKSHSRRAGCTGVV